MNGYIYNVTIGADRSCAPDVMYYIEHKLFPAWADREGWQNAKLLSIPTHREDGISVALQFEIKHPDLLKGYALEEDPLVARIAQAYSDKVTFYPTLMEIIK
ncbi:MAG: DUF4286 family protein [Porphyromonas sp.]|nr:DUF4286 family protein [Porphyromonas sp.]